jgi:transposase
MSTTRRSYPSDVTDGEWEFLLPYLCLMREDAPQREHPLRELFNALRYVVKTGCQWRFLPHDFPPWTAVYQQARRWVQAGVFEAIAHDLRIMVRLLEGRNEQPSATILDSRTLQSTPESGARAGFDGAKKKKGSKVHAAVDTLGNLLALAITAGNEQDRAQVATLAQQVQDVTGEASNWLTPIRATRAPMRPSRRNKPRSNWRSSSIMKPNGDLCCCPNAGWWNGPSAGWAGSAAWPATTND